MQKSLMMRIRFKIFLYKETSRLLQEAINKLPQRRREIFLMSRMENKSHKEIAEILGISAGTVNIQLVQALATLRTYLHNAEKENKKFSRRIYILAFGCVFIIMSDHQQLTNLLMKYFADSITREERGVLRELLDVPGSEEVSADIFREIFDEQVKDSYNFPKTDARIKAYVTNCIRAHNSKRTATIYRVLRSGWLRYAAAIVLFFRCLPLFYTFC